MKLTMNTTGYNHRRYGTPWIATVDFGHDPKGRFTWGHWVGDEGREGILIIEAEDGAIVAQGQKDYRGRNSECTYYQVRDGALVKLVGKAEAYRLATETKS